MRVEEVERLSKKELRARANACFANAEFPGFDRASLLFEAQFFMRELEHRSDSRVSIRDLILEIVVVVLIGWEIYMGYQQENQQVQAFIKQQTVLTHLETSSGATADTLTQLKATMETMNAGIQTELGLNYDVAVDVTFDNQVKRINIVNKGRTNIYLWGDKLDKENPVIEGKGRMITPGGSYYIIADTFYTELQQKMPKGSERMVPFEVFMKNESGVEFVIEAQFFPVWYLDILTIHTQTTSVRRTKWDLKGT